MPYDDMEIEERKKPKSLENLDAIKEFKKLTDQRNYKTSNNLYEIARTNEKFVTGVQWDGVNSKNLKKTVYNFIGQTVHTKNASILANELGILRSAENIDENNDFVQEAIKAFNLADRKNWERLQMDNMNEEFVYNASLEGLGVSYWYWDNDIETGNTFKVKGDINGKLVDMIDLYVANPAQCDIQKQPWIKITCNMTVTELREYAKGKGLPDDKVRQIVADEQDKVYRAFDKTDMDADSDQEDRLATLIINLEMKDGQVWKSETTQTLVIEEWKDIDMTIYPVAIMPYKRRKSFIYGEAEPTRYIENQKVANTQIAARHLHAILMAVPKVLVNENMTGSFSNAIGSVNKVKLPPGSNIANAISYVQPASMTIDVDKSVEDSITRTMDLAGINQNLQGAARPENAAALLTQIKQASVPLDAYKRRLYKYIEDVGRIWLEFYKTKYNITRMVQDEEGNQVEYIGTDYADVLMNTKTDVGPSTQWSEVASFQMLMDMWNAGIITDANQVLSRLPKNMLIDQDGLIDENGIKQVYELIVTNMVGQENAQQILQLPPEEQIQLLMGGAQSGMSGM